MLLNTTKEQHQDTTTKAEAKAEHPACPFSLYVAREG
jgi:hypothetical protein